MNIPKKPSTKQGRKLTRGGRELDNQYNRDGCGENGCLKERPNTEREEKKLKKKKKE